MLRKPIGVVLILLLLGACSKEVISHFATFEKPADFPEPVYHFASNEITEEKFELGRKLFYEPRLSRDNTISCASCHIQSSGFTQHGHDVSHGIDDRLGSRNSPPVMNLAWSPTYFWDGGVFDLDLQPIAPILNVVEMDEKLENVLNKLRAHPDYPGLFKKAFGTDEISSDRFLKALSQYMLMLVSDQSKYDSVMRKQGPSFTDDEAAGYTLFIQNCSSCHKEPLFTDYSFRNNGIGIGANNDKGRYLVTLNELDLYKFKVPSLRNLSYTSPYMHDGRFISLEAVLEQYALHVQATPNLDNALQQNGKLGLSLNSTEQKQIISFLKTLNDKNFITNKRFAEP
ncbi:MAG TPA: cytochrome c peroxidase [Flavihumibacter sp.]|nr:cytochrome c peroxidase [Flavihumibacter sp.]HQD08395.1 cytochrome c peroxidase [Flavihumibacter sp.]